MSDNPAVKIENIIWIVILAFWFVVQMVLGWRKNGKKQVQGPASEKSERPLASSPESEELPLEEQIKRMLGEFAGIPPEDMPPIKKAAPVKKAAPPRKTPPPRLAPVRSVIAEEQSPLAFGLGKEGEVLHGSSFASSRTLREVPSHAGRGLLFNTVGIRMPLIATSSLIRSPGMVNNTLRPQLTDRQQLRQAIVHQSVLSRPIGW